MRSPGRFPGSHVRKRFSCGRWRYSSFVSCRRRWDRWKSCHRHLDIETEKGLGDYTHGVCKLLGME